MTGFSTETSPAPADYLGDWFNSACCIPTQHRTVRWGRGGYLLQRLASPVTYRWPLPLSYRMPSSSPPTTTTGGGGSTGTGTGDWHHGDWHHGDIHAAAGTAGDHRRTRRLQPQANKKGKPIGKAVLTGFVFDFSAPLNARLQRTRQLPARYDHNQEGEEEGQDHSAPDHQVHGVLYPGHDSVDLTLIGTKPSRPAASSRSSTDPRAESPAASEGAAGRHHRVRDLKEGNHDQADELTQRSCSELIDFTPISVTTHTMTRTRVLHRTIRAA